MDYEIVGTVVRVYSITYWYILVPVMIVGLFMALMCLPPACEEKKPGAIGGVLAGLVFFLIPLFGLIFFNRIEIFLNDPPGGVTVKESRAGSGGSIPSSFFLGYKIEEKTKKDSHHWFVSLESRSGGHVYLDTYYREKGLVEFMERANALLPLPVNADEDSVRRAFIARLVREPSAAHRARAPETDNHERLLGPKSVIVVRESGGVTELSWDNRPGSYGYLVLIFFALMLLFISVKAVMPANRIGGTVFSLVSGVMLLYAIVAFIGNFTTTSQLRLGEKDFVYRTMIAGYDVGERRLTYDDIISVSHDVTGRVSVPKLYFVTTGVMDRLVAMTKSAVAAGKRYRTVPDIDIAVNDAETNPRQMLIFLETIFPFVRTMAYGEYLAIYTGALPINERLYLEVKIWDRVSRGRMSDYRERMEASLQRITGGSEE